MRNTRNLRTSECIGSLGGSLRPSFDSGPPDKRKKKKKKKKHTHTHTLFFGTFVLDFDMLEAG